MGCACSGWSWRSSPWGPGGGLLTAGEGLVHGDPRQGGEVIGKRQDGHRMSLVQEDGSEDDVAEEATEMRRT